MANEPYNININANVKAEELQKLIAELNALNVRVLTLLSYLLNGKMRFGFNGVLPQFPYHFPKIEHKTTKPPTTTKNIIQASI